MCQQSVFTCDTWFGLSLNTSFKVNTLTESCQCMYSTAYNKKVCCRWLHSTPCVKRETRIFPIGVGALGPKFTGMESPPAKMFILFDGQLLALRRYRWSF